MLLFVLCQQPGSCCTIILCINTHFFQQYPAPAPAHFILWFSHSFRKEEGSCREVCGLQHLCISAHQSHSFPSPHSVSFSCDVAALKHYLFYNQVNERQQSPGVWSLWLIHSEGNQNYQRGAGASALAELHFAKVSKGEFSPGNIRQELCSHWGPVRRRSSENPLWNHPGADEGGWGGTIMVCCAHQWTGNQSINLNQ